MVCKALKLNHLRPFSRGSIRVCLFLAIAAGPGVLTWPSESASPRRDRFIYDRPPTPQCHATTLVETPAGLAAAWFGGTHEKNKDVGVWFSRFVDGSWSKPLEVADGIQTEDFRFPCWNPVLFQVPEGPLLLFYKVGPSPSAWWGMLKRSVDSGRTWSKAVRLPEEIAGPIKNKPILLKDGRLLCGSSTENQGWRVHVEWTKDFGETWERTGVLNDGKTVNAIQPTIFRHLGDRLQMLCRNRDNSKILQAFSEDSGSTWSELKPTSLPNPNSGIDGVTLADGRHLLVYNHTSRGRSPLNVAVSDDGTAWSAAVVLEDSPGEFSYPAVIQSADGVVHITYTWKRIRVKHVVLDPARFKLRPIVDGVWPK